MTRAPAIVNPGPLLTGLAARLGAIPGWFNLDDLAHFTLVLETQTASGLQGDLLELGCYHGRSAAVLASHLRDGERLFLADAFDLPLDEPYGDTSTPGLVWRDLESAVPNLPRERIGIGSEGAAAPVNGSPEAVTRLRLPQNVDMMF